MGFHDLIHRTWQENILFTVMLELTYRCNLNCFFCYNDLDLQGKPLATEDYLRLLDELADLDCMNLILTGGEPLAHPGFFQIGARARELGFMVRIKSNGHALRNRIAERLKEEVDPFVVDISLHGDHDQSHDRQTRVPGSFDRLMSNIPQLQSLGMRLKLNATLTTWNEDQIEGMFAIADGFGIPIAINPDVTPRDDGDQTPQSIAPSRDAVLHLYRVLDRRHRERAAVSGKQQNGSGEKPQKNCGAGSSSVTVDPFGNVLPCVQWRRPVGNLHEQSLTEIWKSSIGLTEIRRITSAAPDVVAKRHGTDGGLMGFCPGRAELETGNPLADYASGVDQMDNLVRVRDETRGKKIPVRLIA